MLCELHERFLQERKYLRNVSPTTITFYQSCFKALPLNPETWKADLLAGIERLKGRGVKPRSINDYIRGNKGFLAWCREEGIVKEPIKIAWLKEEQKVLETFSADSVRAIINWKPIGRNQTRVCALALTALDTGLRVNELLCLTRKDMNLDSLTLLVKGKGNKERIVPMSIELRKILYRYFSRHEHSLVFCTKKGGKLTQRNVLRDFKLVCNKIGVTGVRCSFHTLRHSFAVGYLRRGGNLEFLRRILGHSSILTTQKYLRSLGVEDLQAVHNELSLLSR